MFKSYFLHVTFVLAEILSSKGTHLVESKANNGSFVMHDVKFQPRLETMDWSGLKTDFLPIHLYLAESCKSY